MRYPIIFLILAALLVAMPLEREKRGEHRPSPVDMLMNDAQQAQLKTWLDGSFADVRAMPPSGQLLVMVSFIILTVCAAVVLSYLINSLAALAGLGLSVAVVVLLLAGVLLTLPTGWCQPRQWLQRYLKTHAEFGPFVSRAHTWVWKRRFRRAAAEHGFAREY